MKIFAIIFLLITNQKVFASSNIFTEISLDGIYDMNIQIGDRNFTDILILKGDKGKINLTNFDGAIAGSVTVPNTFTSSLSGHGRCRLWGSFCIVDFSIVAHENGQSFNVHYKGEVIPEDYLEMLNRNLVSTIRGTAYLDNAKVLGNFIAVIRK